MPPTPHRRGVSIPDGVFLATGAMSLTPTKELGCSSHSRRNSPTSVLAVAEHAVFSAKEEDLRKVKPLFDKKSEGESRDAVLCSPPPLNDAREDASHPLLRDEPSPPEAKRHETATRSVGLASDDLALPSRPPQRSHRRCQTDPCVQKLQYREEEDFILDGLRECLKKLLSDLGDSHPRVGLLYNQIGTFHFRRRDFASSEAAYHEALSCFRSAFKCGHASTTSINHGIKGSLAVASTLGNVGAVHWKTGRLNSAVAYLEEALRVQEKVAAQVHGRESLSSSSSSFGSGGTGAPDLVEDQEDAKYGGGSVEMAQTLHNLGIARTLRGDFRSAKRTLLRSLRMFERHCGPYHVDVAHVQDALGRLYALRGKLRKALECHVAGLRIKSAILNTHHPSLLSSMMKVAAGHRALGQLNEAEVTLREVLECQGVALLRSVDPSYRRSMTALVGKTMRMIGEVQRERNELSCVPASPSKPSVAEDEDACTLTFSISDGEEEGAGGGEEPSPSYHGSADDWGV